MKGKKKRVHKTFGNQSESLRSLKYRVNLKGTPREKVRAQKHNASLLISNPAAYILPRHSIILCREHLTHMLRGVYARRMERDNTTLKSGYNTLAN